MKVFLLAVKENIMATTIQSVERAARVFLYVADHPRVQASEISEKFGLTAPTTHHMLNTLVQTGLLKKDAARQYELGPAAERIAERAIRQLRPPIKLRVALHEFARRTGESCYLTAWRGDRISVIAAVEGNQAVRVEGLVVGYSENIHARVGARVMLAYADSEDRDWVLASCDYAAVTPNTVRSREELEAVLQQIRETGVAIDREQLQIGVHSLAAPIFIDGEVRAALSLTAPIDRFRENEAAYLAAIRECAALPEAVG